MVDQQQRIVRFRERLEADPASGVFVPLADLMAAAGDIEGALAVLKEGLARNPRSIPGRVVLGRTLLVAEWPRAQLLSPPFLAEQHVAKW